MLTAGRDGSQHLLPGPGGGGTSLAGRAWPSRRGEELLRAAEGRQGGGSQPPGNSLGCRASASGQRWTPQCEEAEQTPSVHPVRLAARVTSREDRFLRLQLLFFGNVWRKISICLQLRADTVDHSPSPGAGHPRQVVVFLCLLDRSTSCSVSPGPAGNPPSPPSTGSTGQPSVDLLPEPSFTDRTCCPARPTWGGMLHKQHR